MERFEVFVRSPFGKYRGRLDLLRENGRVEGVLSFLHFSSDFSGAENGDSISFSGIIDTPVGKIEYQARATISGDSIKGSAETRLGSMFFSSKEGR